MPVQKASGGTDSRETEKAEEGNVEREEKGVEVEELGIRQDKDQQQIGRAHV